MRMSLLSFELPLRHPFTISRGTVTVQPTFIVELEQDGVFGYGEATTNPYYGVTLDSLAQSLEHARGTVESWDGQSPEALWDTLAPTFRDDPFAHCALDQAAHDLWGKRLGQPVYRLWGLETGSAPVSNYTIGIDHLDTMVAKLREVPDWPVYKIKLGTPDDLAIVRRLREVSDAPFRVDANCGWTAEETLAKAAGLADENVEFIEQPLPADRWREMRELKPRCPLPLIADESCQRPDDDPRCCEAFHGINIKLVKCGGLTPARRMIQQARLLGLQVMVGCMTESSIGISAIAQLLPMLDYVDMDGAVLLARDIARGVVVEHGVCRYPDTPGCGVQWVARDEGVPLGP